MACLGHPIAEIDDDGNCIITKPAGTGGRIDAHTMKEQLLYEVHDPAAYFTPDVIADISDAQVTELAPERVRLTSTPASLRPDGCGQQESAGRVHVAHPHFIGRRVLGRAP